MFIAFLWNSFLSLTGYLRVTAACLLPSSACWLSKICENGSFIFQSQVASVRPLPKLHATNGGCPFKHFSVAQTLPWQLTRTTSDSTHTHTNTHTENTLILTVGHKNTGHRPWQSINHVQNELVLETRVWEQGEREREKCLKSEQLLKLICFRCDLPVCVWVFGKRTSKHCDNSGSGLIEKILQSAHNISALAQLAKMLYMLNQKGERNGIGDRKWWIDLCTRVLCVGLLCVLVAHP